MGDLRPVRYDGDQTSAWSGSRKLGRDVKTALGARWGLA
jgi:hypothetical protein